VHRREYEALCRVNEYITPLSPIGMMRCVGRWGATSLKVHVQSEGSMHDEVRSKMGPQLVGVEYFIT
jgi:hypothetical protein